MTAGEFLILPNPRLKICSPFSLYLPKEQLHPSNCLSQSPLSSSLSHLTSNLSMNFIACPFKIYPESISFSLLLLWSKPAPSFTRIYSYYNFKFVPFHPFTHFVHSDIPHLWPPPICGIDSFDGGIHQSWYPMEVHRCHTRT